MEQGSVAPKFEIKDIVAIGRRPEAWLIALLLWTLGSAARSVGTPWAPAAGTEALRWGAGITLALTLGWFWRQTEMAGQFLVTLTGAMALFGVFSGETAAHSGLVGPYHDHQLFGSVLVLLLPFSAAFAFCASSALWRWGALASLAAGTLCLLLSQTRSAWAGLVAAAFVFGWLWLSRPASRPHRLRVALVPAVLLLSGLLLAWLFAGPAAQQAAMAHRAATLTALSEDGSWQGRLSLWRGTAQMIAVHPVLGIGLGHYPGSVRLWTHSGGLFPPTAHPSLSDQAHSFYGQTGAELGLVGLALYAAALAAFGVLGLRHLQESRRVSPQNALQIAVLSALAGQAVDALASPSWQFPEVSFVFWAVFGLGLASLRQEQPQPAPTLLSSPLRRAGQFALSGGLAVALTAQVLPIGLLTPVEAYDHVAAVTFQSATLSQNGPAAGGVITFALKALYSDGGVQDVTLDTGGITNQPSSFSCLVSSSNAVCVSRFGTGALRNQLTVSSSEVGKALKITGSFEDVVYASAVHVGTPTYSRKAAPVLVITP